MAFLISVTEAVRSFTEIIGRVYYKGEAFVEYLIRSITALSFDEEVARTHARLFNYLKDKGTMIGAS